MSRNRPIQPPERWTAGMVLVRESRALQAESYSQEFIAGLDESISKAGGTFLVKIVPDEASERATFERWAISRHIRSVVIEELTLTDTRRAFLDDLGLAVTVVGDVAAAGDRPAIWFDHTGAMLLAVRSLYELGHRQIARVSGPRHFHHSVARSKAFAETTTLMGISATEVQGDYSRDSGARATRDLLDRDVHGTAILFDNDLMALGGMTEIVDRGGVVPDDISIVAWDDSVRCQMSVPPLAALSHDVREVGQMAGDAVAQARNGHIIRAETPPPIFVLRRSAAARNPEKHHRHLALD